MSPSVSVPWKGQSEKEVSLEQQSGIERNLCLLISKSWHDIPVDLKVPSYAICCRNFSNIPHISTNEITI